MAGGLHAKLGVFGAVPLMILKDQRITPNALRVFIALSSFEGAKEGCNPGHEDIAERAGLKLSAVGGAVKVLVNAGWIGRARRGHGRTDRYCIQAFLEEAEEFKCKDGRDGNAVNFLTSQKMETLQNLEDQDSPKDGDSNSPKDGDSIKREDQEERPKEKKAVSARAITDAFWKEFQERCQGQKPVWKAQYAKMAQVLATTQPLEVVLECMAAYFDEKRVWWFRKGLQYEFAQFFSHYNEINSTLHAGAKAIQNTWAKRNAAALEGVMH
ncbi:MAG: helix-turn-helix domain-containing protein [bacterium]